MLGGCVDLSQVSDKTTGLLFHITSVKQKQIITFGRKGKWSTTWGFLLWSLDHRYDQSYFRWQTTCNMPGFVKEINFLWKNYGGDNTTPPGCHHMRMHNDGIAWIADHVLRGFQKIWQRLLKLNYEKNEFHQFVIWTGGLTIDISHWYVQNLRILRVHL